MDNTTVSSLTSVFILIAESGKEGGGHHTGGQYKRIQRALGAQCVTHYSSGQIETVMLHTLLTYNLNVM